MSLKKSTLLFSLSLFISISALAQSANAQPLTGADEEERQQKELEKKALALVDQTIKDVQLLRLPENRIRIKATAASLIWKRDEKRARALFQEVTTEVRAIIDDIDGSDPQLYNQVQSASQLRNEVLQMISTLDPQLALDFIRATRQPPSPYNQQPDQESQLEMRLAVQIAATDPIQALRIGEEVLKKELSYELVSLISQIRTKDVEAAAKLASSTLKKLQTEDLAANRSALFIAIGLLNLAVPTGKSHSDSDPGRAAASSMPEILNEQSLRELVNLLVAAAMNIQPKLNPHYSMHRYDENHYLATSLQQMMPAVEKYAPSRALALRKSIEQLGELDPRGKAVREYNELMSNGTINDLLEAAKKASPDMRDTFYRGAAMRAANEGNIDRARQIIDDSISNPYQRKQMLREIDQQAVWREINEADLDKVRQLLPRLGSDEERARVLMSKAMSIAANKDDKKLALQLLGEARQMAGNQVKNYNHMNLQSELASAYAHLEPNQSFNILEPLIDKFNELISAAVALEGFEISGYFKEEELVLQPHRQLTGALYQCMRHLASLGRADFDRAESAAGRLQRDELRLMARLLLAQALLSNLPAAVSQMNRQAEPGGNKMEASGFKTITRYYSEVLAIAIA